MVVKTYKSSPRKLEYQRKYNAKNRERARIYAREYYHKNREKQVEYFKNRYRADPEKYKELNRNNYQEHREERLLQSKIKRNIPEEKEKIKQRRIVYYANNKDIIHRKSHEHYLKNREKYYASNEIWRKNNREKINTRAKEKNLILKKEVFNYYGGVKCACCGEKELSFLSIDHMNGGGGKHRQKIGNGGINTYRWLRKNNFPEGYQVLCHNCNQAKGHFGVCPHHMPQNTFIPL